MFILLWKSREQAANAGHRDGVPVTDLPGHQPLQHYRTGCIFWVIRNLTVALSPPCWGAEV